MAAEYRFNLTHNWKKNASRSTLNPHTRKTHDFFFIALSQHHYVTVHCKPTHKSKAASNNKLYTALAEGPINPKGSSPAWAIGDHRYPSVRENNPLFVPHYILWTWLRHSLRTDAIYWTDPEQLHID